MDTVYAMIIIVITMGSILLNVVLVCQRDYYKTSVKTEEWDVQFWKGTALLYQKQMHEATDRYWKTLNRLSERV